jgi:hypothetical protein
VERDVQGIPSLPDLTHPQELIRFGTELLDSFITLAFLVAALGIAIALVGFSLHRNERQREQFLGEWTTRYSAILRSLLHGSLILAMLVGGFFLCSTLANRYHHWEQAKIAQIARNVAGGRFQQNAPTAQYLEEQPYTVYRQVEDEYVQVQETRQVNRTVAIASSTVDVTLEPVRNLANRNDNYWIDFTATYDVQNPLSEPKQIFFNFTPPYGYSLLQNLRIERAGERLEPSNPGEYRFPTQLDPGELQQFRVTYQAQGEPRWVYDARGQLLSDFRLRVAANFPNADFASGIVPTQIEVKRDGTVFNWVFEDNVSVKNPFGVFTATETVSNTGVIPQLLLLAPGLFLWWLLLLYLTVGLDWRNVVTIGGLFFAGLLALTYFSRIADASLAWVGISVLLLVMVWGLGTHRRDSLAAIISTIAGFIVPVFGFLVPYTGATLSLAGLLSVGWLVVYQWYGVGKVTS